MKKSYLFVLGCSALLFTSCDSNQGIETGKYTLTLQAQGGKFSSNSSSTRNYNSISKVASSSSLETPTRDATSTTSYTFKGWYDGKDNSANAITFPYTLEANTTFYAQWEETATKTYNVTFDANGGEFTADLGGGKTYVLSTNKVRKNDAENIIPTKDNYTFLGWWYSTTKKNDPVSFPLTVEEDITLYAMWGSGDGYTVTLDPDGGTFTDQSTANKEISNIFVVNYSDYDKPTKKDKNFVGWGSEKGGTSVGSGKNIIDENITLYAIYSDKASTDFKVYTSDGATYSKSDDDVYTFTGPGTYTLTGALEDGNIIVSATDEDEVNICLSNASITSTSDAPIKVETASKVKIKAEPDTTNYIYDNRSTSNDVNGGAIYSDSDLEFVGKGSLHIEGNYNNGIHGKKDVNIKNQTLYVKGYNNGIKGNNSITVESGDIVVKAVSGNGLITTDNGYTTKSKQKGNIEIIGGTIDIDSYQDGIQAACNVKIDSSTDDEGNVLIPDIDVKTNKYSDAGGSPASLSKLYIRSTTNFGTSGVKVYSYNSGGEYVTNDAEYQGTEIIEGGGSGRQPGGKTTYYVWSINRPSGYENVKIIAGGYTSSSKTYTSNYNMLTVTKYSSSISIAWGNHDASSDFSAKGIKGENIVDINNGTINIKSSDNAIHANADSVLESTSSYGLGTVNIVNGTLTLYTDDKGIHADNYLNVNGGVTTVTTSYEGYEASQININGGETHVYATDDGFNAGSKDSTVTDKQINVYGGFVDIQVGNGDTDGIDSNGTFTQTGGIVVSRASDNNNMSTALDTDGQSTISDSGVFVAIGTQPEAKITSSKNGNESKSFSSNSTHTINSSYSFKVTTSYSKYYYYLGASASKPTIN